MFAIYDVDGYIMSLDAETRNMAEYIAECDYGILRPYVVSIS